MKLINGKKLRLSKMIFDYWRHWMQVPQSTLDWWLSFNSDEEQEGLGWCDGWNASFWYILNASWYQMNDKLSAQTSCTKKFDEYLRDFDEDYLEENNYV